MGPSRFVLKSKDKFIKSESIQLSSRNSYLEIRVKHTVGYKFIKIIVEKTLS